MLPAGFRSTVTQRFKIWFGALSFCAGLICVTQGVYNQRLYLTIVRLVEISGSSHNTMSASIRAAGSLSKMREAAERALTLPASQHDAIEYFIFQRAEATALLQQISGNTPRVLSEPTRAMFAEVEAVSRLGSLVEEKNSGSIDWTGVLHDVVQTEVSLLSGISTFRTAVRESEAALSHTAEESRRNYSWHMTLAFTLGFIVVLQILYFERLWLITPVKRFTNALINPNPRDDNYLSRHSRRQDEIGILGEALLIYQTETRKREEQAGHEHERLTREINAQQAQQEASERFRDNIASILSNLESHATRMESQSERLAGTAADAERQTLAATASTSETSSSIEAVSVSVNELSRTIGDIHRQIMRATEIVSIANAAIRSADEKSTDLVGRTQSIEKVIELIQSVAERTNLLSLNATIEAARAGEVGRGFAVVASEIKTLAIQTSRATGDIRGQLQSVIDASDGIAAIIHAMVGSMNEIDEIARLIAAAAQSQNLATREIDDIANRTAQTARRLNDSISGVAEIIGDASKTAQAVHNISDDLNHQAAALRQSVDQFMKSPSTRAA